MGRGRERVLAEIGWTTEMALQQPTPGHEKGQLEQELQAVRLMLSEYHAAMQEKRQEIASLRCQLDSRPSGTSQAFQETFCVAAFSSSSSTSSLLQHSQESNRQITVRSQLQQQEAGSYKQFHPKQSTLVDIKPKLNAKMCRIMKRKERRRLLHGCDSLASKSVTTHRGDK